MNNKNSKVGIGLFLLIGYVALQIVYPGTTFSFNFIWVILFIFAIPKIINNISKNQSHNHTHQSDHSTPRYRRGNKEQVACEYCGENNDLGREYCEHCGARILPY